MTEELSPEWDGERLADLHRILMWQLLRFASAPLSGTTDVWLVRGVLLPPERRGITRVVLWDGRRLERSVAYDVPLIHPRGDNIPWTHLVAALRQVLVHPPAPDDTDPVGIPIADARRHVLDALDQVTFELGDALHASALMLQPEDKPDDRSHLRLDGFLLQDDTTARLYVTAPDTAGPLGLDVSLLDLNGRVRVGNTALMAALPSLVPDELDGNRSSAVDPYAPAGVFDLTHW
ncbi:hypothetical protein [Streptomyces sp. NBC_00094]|uniref:hypothetical protein n=1 Tax=Streptomyces sp. NBC_00094 TaxID=2903620 RepID=UPI0022568076|nr:hypothetical protein [Streptomyces sp. NBC_00094]MCX5394043.1 hypothetical protein [Streptomyces sp. NBC_00094]